MPSQPIQQAVSWIRGEDDVLFKQVPPEVGKAHINDLLHRHPFHPYNPDLPADHPCAPQNAAFLACMTGRPEGEELFMKHVNCYHTFKTDLMKCLAAEKRKERLRASQAEGATGTDVRREGGS